jgi:hypothetical protein
MAVLAKKADNGRVALWACAVDAEGIGRRARKGRGDRQTSVGVLMHTAHQIERLGVTEPNATGELRTQRAAQRGSGLLRHDNVERVGAP